ncbi:MAG: hypothetical protein B6D36_06735 [Planctomycetes bacterium UTPLA1]|nr:MAG: hypothetical protein B6D36_06735 [Planctomycetes bacterium UTPLA1]
MQGILGAFVARFGGQTLQALCLWGCLPMGPMQHSLKTSRLTVLRLLGFLGSRPAKTKPLFGVMASGTKTSESCLEISQVLQERLAMLGPASSEQAKDQDHKKP